MAVDAWSYSRWKLYSECPFKFKLRHIDKLPEPDSGALDRGKRMHAQLAAYLTQDDAPLPAEAGHILTVREVKDIPNKVVERQMGFTRQWKPTGYFGKDTWLRVQWDVGILYNDNTGVVLDWKTGKAYDDNSEQMRLYALTMFCQYRPITDVEVRLVYVDSGQEQIEDYTRDDMAKLRSEWEDRVAPMFADTTFAPRPSAKCRWCAFAKSAGGQCKFG